MAVQTGFGPYRSLGVQLDMGVQPFIVFPVVTFEANIVSVCMGLAAQEAVPECLLAALLIDVMAGDARYFAAF